MPRALILGGTGMLGRATALRLLAAGWRVTVTGRNPSNMPSEVAVAGAGFVPADRADVGRLRAALADGVELLVDCVCYTAADARLLLPLAKDADSTVLISTKAVYVDAHGNHPNSDVEPRYDGPIRETQATVAPSDIDHNPVGLDAAGRARHVGRHGARIPACGGLRDDGRRRGRLARRRRTER
ncbi:NAD-dependent epimerase/dehydratase family protein [Microbispora sp. NBC_01389]|uniref:NAD-dependent epimerase/dehydratase family protein n=1 Tax=Microbispora sp. NBC_01389 TaxID=2903584 RepID=UPI0032463290